MVKRLLFLTLAITLVVHAQEVSNLRSWVKAATIIQVRIDGLYTQVPVNDSTNVMDVKKYIRNREGILTEYQVIRPYWKRWWTLWLTEGQGQPLKNEELLKRVMSVQNVFHFEIRDTRKTKD